MTEEEAKTKWCPAYRVTNASGYTIDNRASNDPPAAFDRYHCIGSACMAWRWDRKHDGTFTEIPDGTGSAKPIRIPHFEHTDTGYCGLSGRP